MMTGNITLSKRETQKLILAINRQSRWTAWVEKTPDGYRGMAESGVIMTATRNRADYQINYDRVAMEFINRCIPIPLPINAQDGAI
jgi:hypothetical protein